VLAGPGRGTDRRYFELLEWLVTNDAELDGVGFQNHYWNAQMRRDPEELYAQLERYAALGLTLSATEWDCYGGGWAADGVDADVAKAAWLETFLTVFYSHPAAHAFLMWGHWDGQHWKGQGTLFTKDWRTKPALAVWQRLVRGAWRTDERGELDAEGGITLRAHHGEHQLVVTHDGEEHVIDCRIGPETTDLGLQLPD